jgi:protein-S-isoprenylcysteine O-methyltransferase Ste14
VKPGNITILGGFQLLALLVFLTLIVGRTIQVRTRSKVNPIKLNLITKGKTGVMEVLLFAGVNLWAFGVILCALSIIRPPFTWFCSPQLLDSMPTRLVGAALILTAFTIFVLALSDLGTSWRLGIDEDHPGPLVTKGIYAFTRNPIYLFFDLYFLGTFLINGSLFFLIMTVFVALNLHYQILQEERFLSKIHGTKFQAYCTRTARYITWPKLVRSRRMGV